MLSAESTSPSAAAQEPVELPEDEGPGLGVADVLTWLGEEKKLIGAVTLAGVLLSLAIALLLPPTFTARTTFLAPRSARSAVSAAACCRSHPTSSTLPC
jgi:tyrosine-protein kinase Etk/Wzc